MGSKLIVTGNCCQPTATLQISAEDWNGTDYKCESNVNVDFEHADGGAITAAGNCHVVSVGSVRKVFFYSEETAMKKNGAELIVESTFETSLPPVQSTAE